MCEDTALDGAELLFQDVVPGFSLYRATQDVDNWKKGGLGLVDCDGLCMVWYNEPTPEPELPPEEDEEYNELCSEGGEISVIHVEKMAPNKGLTPSDVAFFDWLAAAQNFGMGWRHSDGDIDGNHIPDIRRSWALMQACMRVGYRPDQDGYIWYWLFDRMGRQLAGLPLNDNPRSQAYMFWVEDRGSRICFLREDAPSNHRVNIIHGSTNFDLTLDVNGHVWEISARAKKEENPA